MLVLEMSEYAIGMLSILHFLVQAVIEFSASWRFSLESFTELPTDKMAVSSAMVGVVKLATLGSSLV